ncbi:DUF3443 family protein [Anaeromyxobacter oryzae]|uniref:Lipoprotein n=1 Tax=Anaeromyxobacter oryzae TaxID=2918170 RepID=A0ABM7X022_9BACT|nr:DUF3443 family protein [Anaeromyxobacter oryzae]BDG05095.1 hypothetical protein AMOR_40910 [Anaeromyxobacter oryzae]
MSRAIWLWIPLLAAACGGGGGGGPAASPSGPGGTTGPLPNVVPVSVNGAGCSAGSYLNKPCVSVTVCVPGTSSCQTIDDVLLDTGSTGLRVFSQVLTLPLAPVTSGGRAVAECVSYLDGSSQWGPVVQAGVVLGGEAPVRVPIQLVDATFASRPSACQGADPDPATAGYNGILGVGVFEQDCGDACTSTDNGIYFACGATCDGAALPVDSQVQNPVAALPLDGNGVIVRLPAVPATGATAIDGELVLGIGTRSNNVPPSSVLAYPLDAQGNLRSTLGGATEPAFLDTGSNGLFFPAPPGTGLTVCPAPNADWFCPASTTTLSATDSGAAGSPSSTLTFQVADFDALPANVDVSSEVGGPAAASSGVDWGLPFHLGRDVYLGLEGHSSRLGAGPLAAW